jgi:hypothetical protein
MQCVLGQNSCFPIMRLSVFKSAWKTHSRRKSGLTAIRTRVRDIMAAFLLWLKTMMRSCKQGFEAVSSSTMTRIAFTIAATIFFSSAAFATQSVMVAWNAASDPGIAGYALYYGTTNGSYSTRVDVGTNTSVVVSGLVASQTNYFAVAAYNVVNLEGTASPALTYIVPGRLNMSAGANLSFPVAPGHWYAVQATTNLVSWTNIWQTSMESSNIWVSYQDAQAGTYPHRFYRLVLH